MGITFENSERSSPVLILIENVQYFAVQNIFC